MRTRRDELRLAALRQLFAQQPGPLTTGQVWTYYRAHGLATCRTTARRDLEQLTREGLLTQLGPDNDRSYRMNLHTGGTR
ncbi:hypothetical protein LG634_24885 [Streptomyces bambusae]|uniref:hypothetical protein n=1 Tax=Streptomyces bambusae TaxID=1550616 RepID=UPI001CFE708B|nr:hypothetical protein [Streptomyces bambusae]MCB5168050.1 hypothetical protein [Streptomyces bambusae]